MNLTSFYLCGRLSLCLYIRRFSYIAKPAYCERIKLLSTLKQSHLSDLDHGIDVEEIKERCSLRNSSGCEKLCPAERVNKELEKRYTEFIDSFDESQRKLWKVVKLEHSFLYSEGYAIPPTETLSMRQWLEAMTLPTMDDRLLYYFSLQRVFENRKQSISNAFEQELPTCPGEDGENRQSIFLTVLSSSVKERCENHKLAGALLFGDPLVIDMGFEKNVLTTDLEPIAKQLWEMYLINRSSVDPFHLVFINCPHWNPLYRFLMLHYMIAADFVLATFTPKSYTEMYPRHNSTYMSAQSKESLKKFNPNDVYILGAYHDPLVRKKYSLAKAAEDSVRCLRLPIDEYVSWAHQAPKDLDMDRMLQVLLCVKSGMSWRNAFLFSVPHLAKGRS